jgi:hypothetical protein
MSGSQFWNRILLIGLLLVPTGLALAQVDDLDDDDEVTDGHAPMQFYLQANITDHVNLQITEDRIRHILATIDKYRKQHPESGLTATLLLSGSVSEALAARNSQTHMVDVIKDAVRRGEVELGYDGTDEPTYKTRPLIEFKSDTPEGRWLGRAEAAEKRLTVARDPIKGDLLPGKTGGLKKMQEVFGNAAAITGLTMGVATLANVMPDFGSDSETVHQIRRYNSEAIVFGLPDENPLHSVAYRGWSAAFSKELSPASVTPPELFWQDGTLRLSEAVGVDNQIFRANNGAAALSYVIKRLDRNHMRVIHIELASEKNYLTKPFREEFVYPPTRYAYAHPDRPQLPAEALQSEKALAAAYAKEDELLDWLTEDYLPDHRDSHFVSNATLKKQTPPATGFDISMRELQSSLKQLLQAWGDSPQPPKYLNVRDIYFLSLAETFQVLADALAEQSHTGKLPQSVRVAEVHGPLELVSDRTPVLGEVTSASVAQAAAGLVGKLHDDAWRQVPSNVIPNRVKVNSLDLNPAQFLHLMAEAIAAPGPDTKLQVKPASMIASPAYLGLRTRVVRDMGVVWTYKPAPLLLNTSAVSASR